MNKQDLIQFVRDHDGVPVIPLMGFPGIQLTHTTLKQNVFNWGVQFETLAALAHKFQPDGMFYMMDLTIEANALGLPVQFPLEHAPSVERAIAETEEDIAALGKIDILKDGRVMAFVETLRQMQSLPGLTGAYVSGPFTLAALMLGMSEAAVNVMLNPDLVHAALKVANRAVIQFMHTLAEAGADVVMVLEPSAVILSPTQFADFSAAYLREIVQAAGLPLVLHICGKSNHLIDGMVQTGVQGLSLDAQVDLAAVMPQIPDDVVVMGNISPTAVMVDMQPEAVYESTGTLLAQMASHRNFILSTGCDLPPETPLDNIHAFMAAGRKQPLAAPTGTGG